MKITNHATISGAQIAARLARRIACRNDLSSSAPSHLEVAGGDTTLVVVDMQQVFLDTFRGPSRPPIDAVIRQIKQAIKMGWAIVLLEAKPWRLGETIPEIMALLDGKDGRYPRFIRRSKQTPSGAKEVLEACLENGFGMGLFRITGVYLEACVLDTAKQIVDLDQHCLVRLIEEACSTDMDLPAAWEAVQKQIKSNLKMAISSEKIDY